MKWALRKNQDHSRGERNQTKKGGGPREKRRVSREFLVLIPPNMSTSKCFFGRKDATQPFLNAKNQRKD